MQQKPATVAYRYPEGRYTMRDAGGILVAFDRIPHDVVQAAREWVLAESASSETEQTHA